MEIKVEGKVVFAKRIWDLKEGEIGFSVPWAFSPEMNYLNDSFTVKDTPAGTMQMEVEKTAEGYKIKIPEGYKY